MGFVAFCHRFLEMLEIGLIDFEIRSSVSSLYIVRGLGWAYGHRKIVLMGADCSSRSVLVVGFCGVGPFVVCSWCLQCLEPSLATPGVLETQFGFRMAWLDADLVPYWPFSGRCGFRM